MDISVIICTKNRAESLRETLLCLACADQKGILVEIVIVDNNSNDKTQDIVTGFESKLAIRYLNENHPGKSYCLNRALDEGGLGRIVVILDDDISPKENWFHAIVDTCKRHPECDFFGGRIQLDPSIHEIPNWNQGIIRAITLSVIDNGDKDAEIPQGSWPSGGHFWVRSSVFDKGVRFTHIWLTEPELILGLQDRGSRGIWSGDAVAKHRIQPELLPLEKARVRMAQFGRNAPYIRNQYYNISRKAKFNKEHPILWFLACIAYLFRSVIIYLSAYLMFNTDRRIMRQLKAIMSIAHAKECILISLESNRLTAWLIPGLPRT